MTETPPIDLAAARARAAAEKELVKAYKDPPLSPDLEIILQLTRTAETVRMVLDYAQTLEQRIAMTERVIMELLLVTE